MAFYAKYFRLDTPLAVFENCRKCLISSDLRNVQIFEKQFLMCKAEL